MGILRQVAQAEGSGRDVLKAASLAVRARLRKRSETDRELMERGVKAFVSYIRGYKEHHCKFIFRLQDLDMPRLAYGFALLRIPRMQEVKRKQIGDAFVESEVDPDTVRFREKGREKQRQAGQQAREEKRQREKQERAAKTKQAEEAAKLESVKLTAAKRQKLSLRQDLDDLEDDYRLLKRAKKGKVSAEVYEKSIGLLRAETPVAGPKGASEHGDAALTRKDSLVTKALKKKLKRKKQKAGKEAAKAANE